MSTAQVDSMTASALRAERARHRSQTQDEFCARCGMPQNTWTGSNGKGYPKGGQTYCCKGCAEGTGCTCTQVTTPPPRDGRLNFAWSGARRIRTPADE
jgi:hypothetical protein